jgi:hypothetical protein
METGVRAWSARAVALGIVTTIAVAAAFSLGSTFTSSVAGGDVGDLDAAVRGAIDASNAAPQLLAGMRAGHLSSDQRAAVRDGIRTRLTRYLAGTALTNRLSSFLAWADRIAANPGESRVLSYQLRQVEIDHPVVAGSAATISGRYVIIEEQGYDLPDGRTATFGGTYTQSFAFELQRQASRWVVTAFTDQPLDFVPDPAMDANLDVNPNPAATKEIPKDYVPVPVAP